MLIHNYEIIIIEINTQNYDLSKNLVDYEKDS